MLGNERTRDWERQSCGETQRQTQRGKSVKSIETDSSLREPWALWEPGENGKREALCTPLLDFGSLTGPPSNQTIAGTLVRAQLVALNGFTSGTFLCLPASRLEVSQGARPRSCSQIPPPHSLGAKSKPATIGCTVGAIWLSSCPGRERSCLTGSRIGHHFTLGGGQSAKCLPWGRKQTLELRAPAPSPPSPEPRGAGHSRPSLCIPGHMGWASFLPALLPGPTFLSNHSPSRQVLCKTEKSKSLLSAEVPDTLQIEEKQRQV